MNTEVAELKRLDTIPVGAPTIAVVVATTGRPKTSRKTLERLISKQSLLADRILVVAVTPDDIAEIQGVLPSVESYLTSRGLCHQRNYALDMLGQSCDVIVFFDDDFVAAEDYLKNVARLFHDNIDIVGATGRLIADGIGGVGFSFEEAESLIAADGFTVDWNTAVQPKRGLYGCNMAYRSAAITDLRFDENLPLYGWQEDVDFSYRLRGRGRRVICAAMAGVHMGEKLARGSGVRLGYSQIANPIYLMRKGAIPADLARRLIRNNVTSNISGSIRPEPWVDRRGRLVGNIIAARDYVSGKIDPRRILEIK